MVRMVRSLADRTFQLWSRLSARDSAKAADTSSFLAGSANAASTAAPEVASMAKARSPVTIFVASGITGVGAGVGVGAASGAVVAASAAGAAASSSPSPPQPWRVMNAWNLCLFELQVKRIFSTE